MGLIVTSLGYMVTLGGLKIYLLGLASQIGDPQRIWPILLSAQGLGAVAGSLLGSLFIKRMEKHFSIPKMFAVASLAEGLLYGGLYDSNSLALASVILVIVGIPESIAFILYYTLLQKNLVKEDLANYHSITLPFFDFALYIGVILGGFLLKFMTMGNLLMTLILINTVSVVLYLPAFFSRYQQQEEEESTRPKAGA